MSGEISVSAKQNSYIKLLVSTTKKWKLLCLKLLNPQLSTQNTCQNHGLNNQIQELEAVPWSHQGYLCLGTLSFSLLGTGFSPAVHPYIEVRLFKKKKKKSGLLVTQLGWKPCPLHWECRVLTTGPPGKSLLSSFQAAQVVRCRVHAHQKVTCSHFLSFPLLSYGHFEVHQNYGLGSLDGFIGGSKPPLYSQLHVSCLHWD